MKGENQVMISALLRLLHKHEAPRVEAAARNAVSFAEALSSEKSDPLPPTRLREIRQEDLAAVHMIRPLVPEDAALASAHVTREYKSFLKSVDRITKKPDDHALDVFH
jgi:hypothetical protein